MKEGRVSRHRWTSRLPLAAVALLLTLGGSIVWMYPTFIGEEEPASFSMCEEADDGDGEPRLECQAADIRYQATEPDDSDFGFSVATGRLNGDEMDDLVVGDPLRNRVYVLYGRPSVTAAYGLLQELLDREVAVETGADIIFEPPAGQAGSFGFSVAIGGLVEVVGCGPDEEAGALAIGAPGEPGTTGNAPGTVFYFAAGVLCQDAADPAAPTMMDPNDLGEAFQSPGAAADDEFGYSVILSRLFPLPEDEGVIVGEEVVVGARAALGGNGTLTVFPVRDNAVVQDPAAIAIVEGMEGDGLGEVLAVGDLDQDFDLETQPLGNLDDLAAGAVGADHGKVVLIQGPLTPDGSVDGDGVYREDEDVEVQSITGENPGDYLGFSVAISRDGALAAGAIYAENVPPDEDGTGSETNVDSGGRLNAGKVYFWNTGLYDTGTPPAEAASADVVYVARRSGDQLGFGVAFGDLDGSEDDDLILTARREDGTGLDINQIDQGTAYISFEPAQVRTCDGGNQDGESCTTDTECTGGGSCVTGPVDLNDCPFDSDCTGVLGIDVMIFGGDRNAGEADELGFSVATGDFNGDAIDDVVLSSRTQDRVYVVTLDDADDDRLDFGRNIRDDDDDEDGDPDSTDCDPLDPLIFSGADEILCNEIDENCNGMDDDAPDDDGDGFDQCGDELEGILPDCDDDDPESYPEATEVCDGNDNDCDGDVPNEERDLDDDLYVSCDEWNDLQGDDPDILDGGDCDAIASFTYPGVATNESDPSACMKDFDEDGYGDLDPPITVTPGTDCDDGSDITFPGAAELDNPSACMRDFDDDGYGDSDAITPVTNGTDCLDDDPNTFPGAAEVCDGNDNVCDSSIPTDELDVDGDGYVACAGWDDTQEDDPEIAGGGDCDEDSSTAPDTFPGAAPNEVDPDACTLDEDGDDYGDAEPPAGVTPGTDCDDGADFTFPGAAPLDNPLSCMKDQDGDRYGDDDVPLPAVEGSDCDDDDSQRHPTSPEIPDDGIDQDCNDTDTVTCFVDDDGDDFGGPTPVLAQDGDCDDPGESEVDTDCDDTNDVIFPGQTEIPDDGIDQDCNDFDSTECFEDLDGDGVGSTNVILSDDTDCLDAGESDLDTDCDESDANTYPGAPQICDGVDNTCGGSVPVDETDVDGDRHAACLDWQGSDPLIDGGGDCDESAADTFPGAAANETFASACMKDSDDDDYGDSGPANPGVTPGTDCDDGDVETFVGAAPLDSVLVCMKDADGDDYGDSTTAPPVVPGSDCDDSEPATFPGAAPSEAAPSACMKDLDGDDYGDLAPPLGVTPGTDCDDDSAAAPDTFPGAPEFCDGNDNSCSGGVPIDEQDTDADLYVACDGWADVQGDNPGILGSGDCDPDDGFTFPRAALNEADPDACRKDSDGDDYGDANPLNPAVTTGTDCDDDSAAAADTFPGAAPNEPAPAACMTDADGDDYGDDAALAPVTPGTDCDDGAPTSFPGAAETPGDGIDQDCSGADLIDCFVDGDGDGVGGTGTVPPGDGDCDDPGESPFGTDCDDADPTSFPPTSVAPGGVELPDDTVDQDCNGSDSTECFEDLDADGFGSNTIILSADLDCLDIGESDLNTDCDDADFDSFPGNPAEVVDDGIDQDCNGADKITCYRDDDQDGFGTSGAIALADDGTCDTGESESDTADDCHDLDAAINPGATEIVDNGIDEDCSGADTITCFVDADQDEFGTDAGTTVLADDGTCDADQGESGSDDDCDDADPGINPVAVEIPGDGIDQDCSGADSLDCFEDLDGDGFGSTSTVASGDADCDDPGESQFDTDCDDDDLTLFPGAIEAPDDGIDQDCNGFDTVTCTVDADQDGFGIADGTTVLADDGACDTDQGEATSSDDCNDADAAIFPGADEVLDDGIDQDCNGADSITCFVDDDQDGFGTDLVPTAVAADGSCDAADRESTSSADCDDADATRYPGAPEVPGDGIDQNCDGSDSLDCFADLDDDGYGSTDTTLSADEDCDDPGESPLSTDCDDADPGTFPGATEIVDDGIDQDCNGTDTVTCIFDFDRDSFGNDAGTPILADDGRCDTAQQEAESADDCDDADRAVYPGAPEIADDGVDQDCSGADTITCVEDSDQDGFGTDLGTTLLADDGACDTAQGESPTADDCDDADATRYPGAPEIPNDDIDQDCDGDDATTCFQDLDGDGYGTAFTLAVDDMNCTDPGESPFDTDCDDDDDAIFPGAAEIADDDIDQDCNEFDTITCFFDADQDGSGNEAGTTVLADDGSCDAEQQESPTSDDCNETDPTIYTGAPELCDGNDNACAGSVPLDELDNDGDGYVECAGWSGSLDDYPDVLGGGDCDDADPLTYPGAAENETFSSLCMKDHDGDGFGDLGPPGGVTPGNDCDDAAADTYLGAAPLDSPAACLKDSDGDDYGDIATSPPVAKGTDCADDRPETNPGAVELCDGNDNTCGGVVPANEQDTDGDLYVECIVWDDLQGDNPGILAGGDCDGTDGNTFPGASPNETFAFACTKDSDGDDYGDLTPPPGVTPGTDCDDVSVTAADTFPGAASLDSPESCMKDSDGDDWGDDSAALPVAPGRDCDDDDPGVFPGAGCAAPLAAIQVNLADAGTVSWSLPTESSGPSTVYRGDLDLLRSTGLYTQEPGSAPEAERFCGVTGSVLADPFLPQTGRAVFYLVTTGIPSGESSLGLDSFGNPRPNTNPCP